MIKILPQLFYESQEFKKLLVDGLSCIIHKKLDQPVWHKEGYVSTHAITLVLNGLLRIENDQDMMTDVPAGKMVFLPKGLYTISDIMPKNGNFEALVFFFEEKVITEFIDSLNLKNKECSKQKCISHLVMEHTERTKIFIDSLLQLYQEEKRAPRELTHKKLFEFLHLINTSQMTDCFSIALATLHNKEKRSLKEFMNANYSKPLGIEDYAYLTGRSLSTFRRDFKTHFGGISPKQWLIDRRLEKAYKLLSEGDTTITDVVFQIGYENIPHFIKAFHKRYNITPKQFLIKKRQEVLI